MSRTTFRVLAIGGTKQVGKDTLYQLLHCVNPRLKRTAFADQLRRDLAYPVRDLLGLDIWTADPAIKELLRPGLIWYGMTQRARNPDHWVEHVINRINAARQEGQPNTPWCVTDCRFANEVTCMRRAFGDDYRLLNLTREGSPPPTEEEERHYRQVAAMADRSLHWGHPGEDRLAIARDVMAWLGLGAPVASSLPS